MTTYDLSLPSGRTIRCRREQMILWGVIAGFIGAAFIAGLYFGILEVNWHIFWLKPGWDGLFKQGWWPTYRHTAFRDIPEPAFATLGVYTMLAKPKYWSKKVATWRIAATPPAVILATLALGVLGTYLLYLAPWAHNHQFAAVVTFHSFGNLLLGFAIGHLMRYLWLPVGATIQGRMMEASADKWSAKPGKAVPVWVKYPLTPPVIRERFTDKLYASNAVKGNLYDHSDARRWLITAMVVVFVLVTVIGVIGHYYVGTGHVFPLLPTTKG